MRGISQRRVRGSPPWSPESASVSSSSGSTSRSITSRQSWYTRISGPIRLLMRTCLLANRSSVSKALRRSRSARRSWKVPPGPALTDRLRPAGDPSVRDRPSSPRHVRGGYRGPVRSRGGEPVSADGSFTAASFVRNGRGLRTIVAFWGLASPPLSPVSCQDRRLRP